MPVFSIRNLFAYTNCIKFYRKIDSQINELDGKLMMIQNLPLPTNSETEIDEVRCKFGDDLNKCKALFEDFKISLGYLEHEVSLLDSRLSILSRKWAPVEEALFSMANEIRVKKLKIFYCDCLGFMAFTLFIYILLNRKTG